MAAPICITPDKICGGPNHVPRSAVQLPTQISQASPKGRPPSPGSRSSLVSAKLVPDALFALVTANVCATVAFARTLSGAPEPFCPVQSLPTGRHGRRRDLPPNTQRRCGPPQPHVRGADPCCVVTGLLAAHIPRSACRPGATFGIYLNHRPLESSSDPHGHGPPASCLTCVHSFALCPVVSR